MNIALFNRNNKESQYKINGDSYVFGTKEYLHRTAFLNVESFVKSRIEQLTLTNEVDWDTNQNNWQIGTMTGYAWCSVFPKNAPSKKILALNLTIHSDSLFTGFLPDWKDYKSIESYGLLLSIFKQHLKEFSIEFKDDLEKYPQLKVWDGINNYGRYSLFELSQNYPWYLDYWYGFDMIQFVIKNEEIVVNPMLISEYFDIGFNLFSGLFEGVNRDYMNMLNDEFDIQLYEKEICERLSDIIPILNNYGLFSDQPISVEESDGLDVEKKGNIRGSTSLGFFMVSYREKIKGYPLVLQFVIKQDYQKNKLLFQIQVSSAGYLEEEIHRPIESVLENMTEIEWDDAAVYWIRSRWLLTKEIDSISTFDPCSIAEKFLKELSHRSSRAYADFKGLKFYEPTIEPYLHKSDDLLDALSVSLTEIFSNQIYKERNLMKGCRYIDYVYSKKKVTHWLGWGLEYRDSGLYATVILNVKDTIKGVHFVEPMNKFTEENELWKIDMLSDTSNAIEPYWIFNSLSEQNLRTSSDWNRNYTAKQAKIDNEKYFWCPKQNDDKQWFQIQLPEVKEIKELKIQGAPHGKTFIKKFNLRYSLDGKNWITLEHLEGLSSGNETNIVAFEKKIHASYLRIEPYEFEGYPGLRIDVLVADIAPSKIELSATYLVDSVDKLDQYLSFTEEKIRAVKTFFQQILGF